MTISGGEPPASRGVDRFLYLCRDNGIHTAIDTAGMALTDDVVTALDAADTIIPDVKHSDAQGIVISPAVI